VTLTICGVAATDIVPSSMRERSPCALTVSKPKWQTQMDEELSELKKQLRLLQCHSKKSAHDVVSKKRLCSDTLFGRAGLVRPTMSQHRPLPKRKVLKVVEVDESSEDEKV